MRNKLKALRLRFAKTSVGKATQWAFDHIKEPKVISFLAWTGYLVLMSVGLYAAFKPPSTIEGTAGTYAMLVTASLVMLGALAGSIGSLPGWREVERLGIVMTVAGASIYGSLIAYLHLTSPGNRSFQLGFIYFAVISLISRWIRIKDGVFEPGSKASKRAQEKHPSIGVDTQALEIIDKDN